MDYQEAIRILNGLFSEASSDDYPYTDEFGSACKNDIKYHPIIK